MLVIKRKLYSRSSSSLRIKRFSQIKEEERLYAFNPLSTIRRVNTLRGAGIGRVANVRANNAYKGLNFRQALSQYRQRGQLASSAKDIHKSMVSNFATGGRLDTRSLQGGILHGTNIGKSNLVGLNAGVKQTSANISNSVRSNSGGGLLKNLFNGSNSMAYIDNSVRNQHITQSKNLVSNLRNAGVTNANIGNLTGAQKNQLLNPKMQIPTYNPTLDPKTLNTSFIGSGQFPIQKGTKMQELVDTRGFERPSKTQRRNSGSILNQETNQLTSNNQKGQSYYESVFKETGADANSMSNTTLSRSKVIEQQNNPVKEVPKTTPQPTKPESTAEKPFEITGLEEQPKTNTSTVENNNPQPQTKPTAETKPEVQPNKDKNNEKFRLGWKGKLALGGLGVGAAAYGGTKLVKDAIDDQDKRD